MLKYGPGNWPKLHIYKEELSPESFSIWHCTVCQKLRNRFDVTQTYIFITKIVNDIWFYNFVYWVPLHKYLYFDYTINMKYYPLKFWRLSIVFVTLLRYVYLSTPTFIQGFIYSSQTLSLLFSPIVWFSQLYLIEGRWMISVKLTFSFFSHA